MAEKAHIERTLQPVWEGLTALRKRHHADLTLHQVGHVISISSGIAAIAGLPAVQLEEVVHFANGTAGLVLDIDREKTHVVVLGPSDDLESGTEVRRTGHLLVVPVGEALPGRVVNPLGQPLDGGRGIRSREHLPVNREAPEILDRAPVETPVQTGIKVIDALIPIGRGQRELILGDRQTGKTAIAVDTIVNQRDSDMVCIYCAIGQRSASVAKVIDDLDSAGAMEHTIVVVAEAEAAPGLQYIAPYAATSMGEYFMEQGRDVLVVYDDLTKHARAYRELSLLMRRPPGREAYSGDIFHIHSRLLERATHLRNEKEEGQSGGSLSALPVIETQAQNISAYIPTNLISITDGQIYLSPDLFQKGILPAVDLGKSVSRVGGKTQRAAYRAVAGDLKLSYSQFEEVESFARFGTRLDEDTKQTIARGRRIRECFKQNQQAAIPVPAQVLVLLALTEGLFDAVALEQVRKAEKALRGKAEELDEEIRKCIEQGDELTEEYRRSMLDLARQVLEPYQDTEDKNGAGEGTA